MNETQLVAFYVSKLSKQKQISVYSAYMETILNEEERKLALSFGEEFSLDVLKTTKTVVENIISRPTDLDVSGNLQVIFMTKKLSQILSFNLFLE